MFDQVGYAAHAHHLGVWIAIWVGVFVAFAGAFLAAFMAMKEPDD